MTKPKCNGATPFVGPGANPVDQVLKSCVKPETRTAVADVVTSMVFK